MKLSFAGLFGGLIPVALLAYGVALFFGMAPNPNALWAQAEPTLRPVAERLNAVRPEDGVVAFQEARNWVAWGALGSSSFSSACGSSTSSG
jgi:hypothetical protein